jgi:hypothetical protein
MREIQGLFAILGVVVMIILALWWHFGRASYLLREWAAKNDFRIIHRQYRHFFKGPFFWTSTNGQAVYYVVIEDPAGASRRGWVRCGSWWFGLLSEDVDVRWEV